MKESNRKHLIWLLFGALFFFASFHSAMANNKPKPLGISPKNTVMITGKVTDIKGIPLVGVAIAVKGTTIGTITNTEGEFNLNASTNTYITVSYLGYVHQDFAVIKGKFYSIKLKEEQQALNEVVVMGYTKTKRRDVSASVASIDMKALEDNTSASLTSMLAGQAAGVQAIVRSGTPGASGGGLVIRGNTNLSNNDGVNGMSNPLYIVDGIPMSLQDLAGFDVSDNDFLSTLNPNEIKSIDILKDAAATAIYGSRGANGVVIIATKRGRTGRARFSASAQTGVILEPKKLDVYVGEAERQEKLNMYHQTLTSLFGNQAWVDVRNGLEVEGYMLPSVLTDKYNPAFNNAYDYQSYFYKSGLTQNYDISMDGGAEKSSYRIGLSQYVNDGILVGNAFSRTTLNASLVNDINKLIHNDFSVRYSYLNREGGLNDYMKAMPTKPTELPSSLFYKTPEEIARMTGKLGEAYTNNTTHYLTFSDAIRLKFNNNFSWDNQASLGLVFSSSDNFIPASARDEGISYAKTQSGISSTLNANSVLHYNKYVGSHLFTFLLGTEINSDTQKKSWMEAENGTSDYDKVINGYQKSNIYGESDYVITNMLSYFGSASWGYKDNTYQIEGVMRRDASSRFGSNNKWATFPSIKTHWAFSKEPWMKGCSKWLDFGKLRLSFGTSGSIEGDPLLQYNSLISISNIGANMNDIDNNKMDTRTYGGNSTLVSDFNRVANKSLSWSKSKEIDYGIDLELFNKRLFVTGDIYSKYLSGLVYTSTLPSYIGFTTINSNLVDMAVNGFELNFTGYLFPRSSDFQWEWTLNLSRSNAKIAKLGNGGRDYIDGDHAFVVGESAFQYYTYEYLGPLQSYDDLPVNPMTGEALKYAGSDAGLSVGLQGRIFPGMPLFTDANGDFQIDGGDYGNDKVIIKNKSPEPKIMGGLHTTLKYKNFSLRIQTSFAFGNYIFNTTLQEQLSLYDDNVKFYTSALYKLKGVQFWEKPGDNAYYPMRFVTYADGGSARSFRKSSMFLEKGDYWSVDNITLSYNLPKSFLDKFHLHGINVYTTAQNIAMWKASKVLDPRTITKEGYYNGGGYPITCTIIGGIKFQF